MKNLLNSFKFFVNWILIGLAVMVLFQSQSYAQGCGANVVSATLGTDNSTWWGTGFVPYSTVHIQSDFYIDNSFTITGCIIKIDPGVRIIVNAGKQLHITGNAIANSHLSACSDMWDGITVEGTTLFGDGLLLIDNNSLIEDAENAVFIPNSSSGIFRIQNTTFNKNWFHILIDHLPGNTYYGVSSVVNSNFFCKDLTTNVYTTLLAPHISDRTFHAISYNAAADVSTMITIGSGNFIENAEIGIYNHNSHTDVIGSSIYDCDIGYFGDFDGTMKLYNSEVHDCVIGVESTVSMTLVDIYNNQIYRISTRGIFIHSNRAKVEINKNKIYEVLDAIVIIDNNNNSTIHDNKIYNTSVLSYSGSHGIYVQQPILYPSNSLDISANYISQFEQGVFISTFDNATVRGNYIDMDFIIPSLAYQIFAVKIENSDYFGVAVNTIKGTTSAANYCDPNTCGVYIENSDEGGILCNEFGDPAITSNQFTFNKNLYMRGVVDMNYIGGNKFRCEHLWSLFIEDCPDGLGVQGDPYYVTDNEWFLPSGSSQCSSTTEDIMSQSSHISSSAITQFHVRTGSPFEHDLPNVISDLPALSNLVSTAPMDDTLCTFLRFSGGNLESSIADGSAFNANNSDAYKWYSENWLYRAIPKYPMYSTPFFTNYYNTLDNGNYGALKNISNQFSTSGSTISTAIFIPSNTVEENIKNMIDIGAQINNQGVNSVSATQKSTIDNLSVLCPQNDGPGVYMARAYRSLLDNQLYEYSSSCIGSGGAILRTQMDKQTNVQSAKLYYSNNELKIRSATTEFYGIVVIDMSGKIVYSTKINSNNSKFVSLPDGIYLYRMTSENNNSNIIRGKLTIM